MLIFVWRQTSLLVSVFFHRSLREITSVVAHLTAKFSKWAGDKGLGSRSVQPIWNWLELAKLQVLNNIALLSTCARSETDVTFFSGTNITVTAESQVAQTLEAQAHLIHPHVVSLLREKSYPAVLEACLKRLPDTLTAVVVRGNLMDNNVSNTQVCWRSLACRASARSKQTCDRHSLLQHRWANFIWFVQRDTLIFAQGLFENALRSGGQRVTGDCTESGKASWSDAFPWG